MKIVLLSLTNDLSADDSDLATECGVNFNTQIVRMTTFFLVAGKIITCRKVNLI